MEIRKRRQPLRRILIVFITYLLLIGAAFGLLASFYSPMPTSITISGGPQGSSFNYFAKQYQRKLEAKGIKVEILESSGSIENLERIRDKKSSVDIGFVQTGIVMPDEDETVMSIGTMFYIPLTIFYRAELEVDTLADFKGTTIGIGEEGTGSYLLATNILKGNGINEENTVIKSLNSDNAIEKLKTAEVDVLFLTGDVVSIWILRSLLTDPHVKLYDFKQADAYVRRFRYLSKIEIPPGTFDLGRHLPEEAVTLVSPAAELLSKNNLNPSVVDMLIDIAEEIHGRGTMFQGIGEFPALIQHNWPLSQEAKRYVQDGKNILYQYLPFGMASFLSRVFIFLAPLLVVIAPLIPLIPRIRSWWLESKIYKQYQNLVFIERILKHERNLQSIKELEEFLKGVEHEIMDLKVDGAYTEQMFILRQYLNTVLVQLQAAKYEIKNSQSKPEVQNDEQQPTAEA